MNRYLSGVSRKITIANKRFEQNKGEFRKKKNEMKSCIDYDYISYQLFEKLKNNF